jgi:elongation factor G
LAFKTACWHAFRTACANADPILIEPMMSCEVSIPQEYQGAVIGGINKRRGTIKSTDEIGGFLVISCVCPLAEMFGYMTELRSQTQGKGEFSMEYLDHQPCPSDVQSRVIQEYQEKRHSKK